ncbi:MAG: hypothetical protein HFJ66_04745 [Eggerthellaceae bacterium]|nr:hypothetical protein [Eggerthellaceae bacterium]
MVGTISKVKKLLIPMMLIASMSLIGCSDQLREEAAEAVEHCNEAIANYNAEINPYNSAVEDIEAANSLALAEVKAAQAVINKGEEPFDSNTLTELKNAMKSVQDGLSRVPDSLPQEQPMSMSDDMGRSDLEAIIEEAAELEARLSAAQIPDIPVVPDYSQEIDALKVALGSYEDSIQSLKQVTAPTDDFIMERILGIGSISEIAAVTEDHDPNGKLNKSGGYVGCIYFRDEQVDWSSLYIEEGKEDVIEVGTSGGGAIEVFPNVEDAERRDAYLASFDGAGMFSSGSHEVVGTLVIRTSDELTATQQKALTQEIVDVLTAVR